MLRLAEGEELSEFLAPVAPQSLEAAGPVVESVGHQTELGVAVPADPALEVHPRLLLVGGRDGGGGGGLAHRVTPEPARRAGAALPVVRRGPSEPTSVPVGGAVCAENRP